MATNTLTKIENIEALRKKSVSEIVMAAHICKMKQKDIDGLMLIKIALLLEKR
jgi:hypothetical protein